MAYTAITTAEVAAGQPTKQELFTKIKDNFDNHETRLLAVQDTTTSLPPLYFHVTGGYSNYIPLDEVILIKLKADITLTGAPLVVVDAGSSGTLTCDVEYKRGGGSWTSIFSTLPSVAYGAGDYAESSNQVLSTTALLTNDLLRLNIDAAQVGNYEFVLYLIYTIT